MTESPYTPHIRPYGPADRTALYDVCVRTGDGGKDARHLYEDPELLPVIFAAPYVTYDPELAFVLDDGTGNTVGYVVGTADTARFVEQFRTQWLPEVGGRYPAPEGAPGTPAEEMAVLLHNPGRMVHPELAAHPAHLHIDLLPDWQGKGYGRALMHRFLAALQAQGVQRVHLCMSTANTSARAFYDRVGFTVIPVPDPGPVTYLGRGTDV